MDPNDLPSLSTYGQILSGMLAAWDSCDPYPQPRWASTLIFYVSAVLTVFYLYVMVIIITSKKLHTQFKRPFHCCTVILAVGDIVSLVVCLKDSAVVACVLGNSISMNLAWQSLGGCGIDFIISVNLVIAIVRLEAVVFLTRKRHYSVVLYILIALAASWGCAVFYLHFAGLLRRIYRTDVGLNGEYGLKGEYLYPFTFLRNDLLFGQLALTFVVYIVVAWQLRQAKTQANLKDVRYELKMLTLALWIFFTEVLFVYTSNGVGYTYLGLGSMEFNRNLNFAIRPITTGITPILYIVCSADVRKACISPFLFKRRRIDSGSNRVATM